MGGMVSMFAVNYKMYFKLTITVGTLYKEVGSLLTLPLN